MKKGYITYTTRSPLSLPIPPDSIDLVVTRLPAFGEGRVLGIDSAPTINTSDLNKFTKDLDKFTKEMYRVLKPSGTMIIDVSSFYDINKKYVLDLAKNSKFTYLGDVYESKYEKLENDPREFFDFNTVSIWHIVSKGEAFFNPFAGKKHVNPVLSYENSAEEEEVVGWIGEKFDSAMSELRPNIASRFVEIFTKPTAVVLDPFGGTGSLAIEAAKLGRSAISSDPNSDTIEFAKLRTILAMGEKYFNENVKVVPFE